MNNFSQLPPYQVVADRTNSSATTPGVSQVGLFVILTMIVGIIQMNTVTAQRPRVHQISLLVITKAGVFWPTGNAMGIMTVVISQMN